MDKDGAFIRVLKNSTYIVLSEQAARAINFFQVILLVRYLGKSDYGVWSTVRAFPNIFIVITEMGMNSIMLRSISRDRSRAADELSLVLSIKMFLTFLFLVVTIGSAGAVYRQSDMILYITISSIGYVLISYYQSVMAVNRALEDFRVEALLNITRSTLFFMAVLVVFWMDAGVMGVTLSLAITGLAMLSLGVADRYRRDRFALIKIKFSEAVTYLRKSAPFAVLNIAGPIFIEIDIIILSSLSVYESVGIYNAPYRIILFLYAIPFAFRRALFPNLSSLIIKDSEKAKQVISMSLKLTSFLALPISVGLFMMAEDIVLLLFSAEYSPSVPVFKIMSLMLLFHFFRSVFNVVLFSANLEKIAVWVFMAGTVANILLDLLLIPVFDYMGAGYASLTAEFLIFFSYMVFVSKKVVKINLISVIAPFVPATIFATVIWYVMSSTFVIVQAAVGAAAYLFFLFATRVITVSEINTILKGNGSI